MEWVNTHRWYVFYSFMVCVLLILSSPLSKRIFIVSILLADYANKWFNHLNHSKPIFIKSELGFLVKYKGCGLKVILVYVLGLKSGVWDWCVGCSVKVFFAIHSRRIHLELSLRGFILQEADPPSHIVSSFEIRIPSIELQASSQRISTAK